MSNGAIYGWWKEKGQVLLFRSLVLILFLGAAARQIPSIQAYVPEERYLLLMVAPLLLLMLEIFLGSTGGSTTRPRLVLLGDVAGEMQKWLHKGKTLDIVCSSSESFYLQFRDDFLRSAITCRILMRNPPREDTEQQAKLARYEALWNALMKENSRFKVEIKYTDNTVLRLFLFDRTNVLFGFYRWSGGRYWGHNVPMMLTSVGSEFGNYLVTMAADQFDGLWEHASQTVGER